MREPGGTKERADRIAASRYAAPLRDTQQFLLAPPQCRRVEQAGDAYAMRQPTLDGSSDETRRQEGQRNRHVDMPLAASLPSRDVVDGTS
jgi:hypothetical protein